MCEEESKSPEELIEEEILEAPSNNPVKPLEKELEEYKNKYLHALADMENMRKRMQKERHEMMRFSVENVIDEFLTPLDNLENALGFTAHMSEETRNWAQGFEMILSQFKDVLSNHGVVPFHTEGKSFDPHYHEAVETEESEDIKEGTILKEFVRGYSCGDRVLRPARVTVAKAPSLDKNRENQEEEKVTKTNDEE